MLITTIIVGVLVADCCFNSINEWLPDYVPRKRFGIIDVLYRLIRIIGSLCLAYPLSIFSWHRPAILLSSWCFLFAFVIKKLVRHLEYKERL